MCIYSRRGKVMCKATLILRPKKADLILTTVREKKRPLHTLNFDAKMEKDDWEIVPDSGKHDHNEFCCKQVPLKKTHFR